ncbi:MAG: low specificity L-threonine aldolase, partial [Anaerotignaceae bacterium]
DNAYFNIARHANEMAYKIKNAFMEMGYKFRYNSSTNQQFPIIPDEKLEILKKKYAFSFWEKYDENHTVVRVCTSWATKEENVVELINDIKN